MLCSNVTAAKTALRPPFCSRAKPLLACALLAISQQLIAQNLLEEVVISSSRVPTPLREVGTSVTVLSQEEIVQRGFLSLPELLRTQPSVAASNTGGVGKATSLRIRGEEGYRTLVIVDGIDISDSSSPQVSPRLEQLLTAGISRVEILRGPQGLTYGADAGGVINIRTATPDEGLGGGVAVEQGRYDTQQMSGRIGGTFENLDFLLSGADFSTDGFNARNTDTDLVDDDGYDNQTLHARAGWNVSDKLRLEAVARRVDGNNAYDGCFNSAFLPSNDCEDSFEQESWRLSAALEQAQFSHELAYSSNSNDRRFFAEGAAFFRAEGSIERLSYLGQWRDGDSLSFVYGVDREEESIDDGSFDRSRRQTGIYGEYQGRFYEQFTVTAGLRHDDNDDFGDYLSYRLSGAWTTAVAGGELKLKGAYGTGFRAPSLYEISYNSGPFAAPPASDTRLVEETSEGYDLGAAWASENGTYLELTWFDQEIDDLITFDVLAFSGYIQDAGISDSRGVELIAELPLPLGLRLSGNYTWNETTSAMGVQRAFRPEHLANLGLAYLHPQSDLRLGINLRSSADAVDTLGNPLDDYVLMDVNASINVYGGLTLYARLENALDEDYRETPTYNTAGQAAYAGVRYEF
ncbi:TonB-dependent receptor plug domain-containing protein [Congregibacter litoralis]|uniref:Outer membrane cobalamin receptor protein n=1 Tax=Congregibacter litoralis KT71 TaxID=314285 RepID=A4A443_9GAMM|nr:TonB-dependent receptor [Congregibacter litoralis]EAQ99466.2 Outer membrane cobalamin receptor protein [Congregibacter litoralis KT71]